MKPFFFRGNENTPNCLTKARKPRSITLKWHEWTPEVGARLAAEKHSPQQNNITRGITPGITLRDILATMPAVKADAIPCFIRLLENPESPLAFPGAVSLPCHDAIHVLLGRGLLAQDEAFVIGFTMGAATKLRPWQAKVFRWLASHWYKPPYRLRERDLISFDLGLNEGRQQACKDLQEFAFEDHLDQTVTDLQQELGIDPLRLASVYAYEQALVPDSRASHRLQNLLPAS